MWHNMEARSPGRIRLKNTKASSIFEKLRREMLRDALPYAVFSSQIMAYPKVLIRTKTRFCSAVLKHSYQQKTLPVHRTLIMSMSHGKSKRPICPSCSKPTRTCLCSRILTPGIENSVSVTILQHSLESKHPLNSTRIARLGLRNLNVVTVSDVNFEARFVIRLLESDSDSLVIHQASDIGETQKPMDENDTGTVKGSLVCTEGVNHVVDSKLNTNDSVQMNEEEDERDENSEGSAITSVISKHGAINSLSHIWMPLTQPQKPTFSNILSCPEACEALSKGFLVKKLLRRQLEGSINLQDEEECEFELKVPPGSVLLFPSKKAADTTDLDTLDFEVKNLIVLDGTWAKAKRVYSENPWLNILPHIKLKVNKMSLYSEVRREPKAGYLSTIESIVLALKSLGENEEGLDNLLDAFQSMVGDQRRFKEERLTKAKGSQI